MKNKTILLLFALLGPTALVAQFSRLDTMSESIIDKQLKARFSDPNIGLTGASVGIIKNGEIVFLKGYGFSNKEASIKATECTMYRVASVSKSVTAAAVLQLVEEGKLNFEDDIRKYVSEFPVKDQGPIKVIHLLQHNSCLGGHAPGDYPDYFDKFSSFNAIEAVKLFRDEPLEEGCTLGSSDGYYSNWGYDLLGAVIERASGIKYETYINDFIVKPLNMPLFQPEYRSKAPYPNQSKGYNKNGTLYTSFFSETGSTIMHLPSGGFIASVTDLTLFAKGLMKGQIFKNGNNTRNKMFFLQDLPYTTTLLKGLRSYPYALGMMSYSIGNRNYYFHEGAGTGFSDIIFFSTDFKDAVIIMTNTEKVGIDNILNIAYFLMNIIHYLNVIDPYEYYEKKIPNSINLSGVQNGLFQWTSKKVDAVNYTLVPPAIVNIYGETITLDDGFNALPGSVFSAQLINASSSCWETGN